MVNCDKCGRDFYPVMEEKWEEEMRYVFFRCEHCGKAYMVSVTDEKQRQMIDQFVEYCKNGQGEEVRALQKEIKKRGEESHDRSKDTEV